MAVSVYTGASSSDIVYVNYTGKIPTKDNITNMTEVVEAYNAGKVIAIKAVPNPDVGLAGKVPFFLSEAINNNGAVYIFDFVSDKILQMGEEETNNVSCPYCIRIQCSQTQTTSGFEYTVSSVLVGLARAFPATHADTHKTGGIDPIVPSDIGAQSKITANGILRGDGTGTITAADETEVELVDLPQEIVWVKYTQEGSTASYNVINAQEILDAYKEGNKTIALKLQTVKSGVNKSCIMYLNFVDDYYIVSNRNYNFWFSGFEVEDDVNTNITTIYPYYNVKLFIQEADGVLNNSLTNLEVHDQAKFPNPTYTKSISLPATSWTGSDPYTQTVTISSITTSKTRVNIQPSEEIYDQLVADNVGYLAIKNVDGTFTAVAKGGKPSVDLTVQVTYNNTVYY